MVINKVARPNTSYSTPAEEILEDEKMNPLLLLGWESLVYHNRIFAKGRSYASRDTGWEIYLLLGAWKGFRDRCLELPNASLSAAEVPHTNNVR